MPSRKDIDPLDLPKLLPYLALVDVIEAGKDFRFRLIGTLIRERSLNNPLGRLFSELFADRSTSQMWHDYGLCVSESTIVAAQIPYIGGDEYTRRAFHFLYPLSSDGSSVDMILTLVDYERIVPTLHSIQG